MKGLICSSNGGGTWLTNNERVSAQGFVPNSDDQFGGRFIGDYNGIAATNPKAHPVWTGYRGQDQDIFYATVGGVPNEPPTADAGGSNVGTEDLSIDFDGSNSSDPDGDDLTYNWDFGDGTMETGVGPTHTYLWGGVFNVTLTVSDGNGGSATDATTATVIELNDPPVANAGGPYSGTVGQPISFNASGSSDWDNQDDLSANDQVLTYNWDFGDGGTKSTTSLMTDHTYTTAGPYTVSLKVYDGVADSTNLAEATATVADAPTGSLNHSYVSEIIFETRTRRGGARHDERITVRVRRDTNANAVADADDLTVSGVSVSVQLTGGLSSFGTTDASGELRTGWFTNLSDGLYWADVTLMPVEPLIWNKDLDEPGDSNGNSLPDEQHRTPH